MMQAIRAPLVFDGDIGGTRSTPSPFPDIDGNDLVFWRYAARPALGGDPRAAARRHDGRVVVGNPSWAAAVGLANRSQAEPSVSSKRYGRPGAPLRLPRAAVGLFNLTEAADAAAFDSLGVDLFSVDGSDTSSVTLALLGLPILEVAATVITNDSDVQFLAMHPSLLGSLPVGGGDVYVRVATYPYDQLLNTDDGYDHGAANGLNVVDQQIAALVRPAFAGKCRRLRVVTTVVLGSVMPPMATDAVIPVPSRFDDSPVIADALAFFAA